MRVTCSHSEDLLYDSLEQVHINDSSVCVSRQAFVCSSRNVHVSSGCMFDLSIGKQVVSLQIVEVYKNFIFFHVHVFYTENIINNHSLSKL